MKYDSIENLRGHISLYDTVVYITDRSKLGETRKSIWRVDSISRDKTVKISNIEDENKSFTTNKDNLVRFRYIKNHPEFRKEYISKKSLQIAKDKHGYTFDNDDIGSIPADKYDDVADSGRYTTTMWRGIPTNVKTINWPERSETKKENEMANTMNKIIDRNSEAAKAGALITAGSTLNGVIGEQLRNQVPRKYRKLLDHPLADVVIANVASFAVQSFASNNYKAKVATDAMMQAAMAEFFASFNIEKIIAETLGSVNLDAFVDS